MNLVEALEHGSGQTSVIFNDELFRNSSTHVSCIGCFDIPLLFLFPHYGDDIDITSQIAGHRMFCAFGPGAQRDLLSCHVFCDKDLRVFFAIPLENPFHDTTN